MADGRGVSGGGVPEPVSVGVRGETGRANGGGVIVAEPVGIIVGVTGLTGMASGSGVRAGAVPDPVIVGVTGDMGMANGAGVIVAVPETAMAGATTETGMASGSGVMDWAPAAPSSARKSSNT